MNVMTKMGAGAAFCCAILVGIGAQAQSKRPMTMTEALIYKAKTSKIGPLLTAFISMDQWCLQIGNSIQYGSFEVAKSFEAMPDGLFHCRGEFANYLNRPQVHVFALNECVAVDESELKNSCPQYKDTQDWLQFDQDFVVY